MHKPQIDFLVEYGAEFFCLLFGGKTGPRLAYLEIGCLKYCEIAGKTSDALSCSAHLYTNEEGRVIDASDLE